MNYRRTRRKGTTHTIPPEQVKEFLSGPIDYEALIANCLVSQTPHKAEKIRRRYYQITGKKLGGNK